MATKQRRPAAKKKATAKTPPTPPARGRATKGPSTAPERGRNVPAKATPEQGRNVPTPPVSGTPAPAGKPNLLQKAAKPKEGATYHRAVLAEFIGAAVLAVLGGVLSPRKRADGATTWVHVIVQLTAICGVYFVLALLSASPKLGKISAAFGLLVLLGVLMNSADAVRKMAAVFAPAKKTATPAPAAGSTQPAGGGTSQPTGGAGGAGRRVQGA